MRKSTFRSRFARLSYGLAILTLVASGAGCNAYDAAVRASNVVGAIISVADAEVAAVPPADQYAYENFVALGKTLEAQLQTCLAAADSGMSMTKKGKMLACFNAFAVGLNSPAELAQLRILNPSTQSKVQKYATAITIGLNAAIAALGGTNVTPPVITQAPTAAELDELRNDPRIQAALRE